MLRSMSCFSGRRRRQRQPPVLPTMDGASVVMFRACPSAVCRPTRLFADVPLLPPVRQSHNQPRPATVTHTRTCDDETDKGFNLFPEKGKCVSKVNFSHENL